MTEIIRGMPDAEYFARPEVSQSLLKHYRKPTPAHAKHAMDNPSEGTDSQELGTCVDALVLSQKRVYQVGPVDNRALKAWKDWAAGRDGILLRPCDAARVEGMAESLSEHPATADVLAQMTDSQVVLIHEGGKAKLDGITDWGGFDLKTCRDASPEGFSKAVLDWGYHIQQAWYTRLMRAAGLPCGFCFVLVESEAPFCAAVRELSPIYREMGEAELDRLLALHRECVAAGRWPGYSDEIEMTDPPAWARRKYEQGEL